MVDYSKDLFDDKGRPIVVVTKTGRSATYVIAASDAPSHVKAQADEVCAASSAEITVNAYLALGNVRLTVGTFNVAGAIIVPSTCTLKGSGWNTKIYRTTSASGATLAEDLDNSETGIGVSDGTKFCAGQSIKIDTEQFFITAVSGNTLTVNTRPHNGTTAAVHNSGAAITHEGPVIVNANSMGLGTEATKVTVRNLWIDAGDDDADVTQVSSPGIVIRKCDYSVVQNCFVQKTQGDHPTGPNMDVLRGNGISLDDADYCTIKYCTVTDTAHGGISIRNAANYAKVLYNIVHDVDYEGIIVGNKTFNTGNNTAEGCVGALIRGNIVWDFGITGSSYGIYVEDQADSGVGNQFDKTLIEGNKVRRVSAGSGTGIGVVRDDGTSLVDQKLDIKGNLVDSVSSIGIRLYRAPGAEASGNRVITCGGSGISVTSSAKAAVKTNYIEAINDQRGVLIQGGSCANVSVCNNTILTTGTGASGHGIEALDSSEADDVLITGNEIVNTNTSGSPNTSAIKLYTDRCVVTNNKVINESVANGFYYCVRIDGDCDETLVEGNGFKNGFRSGGAAVLDSGTNSRVLNNAGYVAKGEIITYSQSLADDGSLSLETGRAGFGRVLFGDGVEYSDFYFTTGAVVTLVNNTANVVNTDTDTKYCVFDGSTSVTVRNRSGGTLTVSVQVCYQ